MKSIEERMATVEEQHEEYSRWNIQQNGRLDKIDTKLDGINKWLLTSVGGIAIGILLAAINLAVKMI